MYRSSDEAKLATCEDDLEKVVRQCYADGYKFIVTYAVRTKQEQAALYAQGRTKPGKIVTWTLNSRHLPNRNGKSEAIDLAPVDEKGNIPWADLAAFDRLGAAMKAAAKKVGVEIEWGGDWTKGKDRPHFQLKVPR